MRRFTVVFVLAVVLAMSSLAHLPGQVLSKVHAEGTSVAFVVSDNSAFDYGLYDADCHF